MIRTFAITVLWGLTAPAGAALAAPDPTALSGSIDKAAPKKANERGPALVAKAEILLDRAHVSPGEIDGLDGDNFRNAVRAFQQVNGLPVSGNLDVATWGALKRDGAPVLKAYTITVADAAGPFTRAIPSKTRGMRWLGSPGLSYTEGAASGTRREVPHEPDSVAGAESARGFRSGRNGTYRRGRARDGVAVRPPFCRAQSAESERRFAGSDVDRVVGTSRRETCAVFMTATATVHLLSIRRRSVARKSPRRRRGIQGQRRFLEPEIRIRSQICVEGRQYEAGELLDRPRPKQSRRFGLDRPDRSDLRRSNGIAGAATDIESKTQSHGCIRLTNWDIAASELAGMVRPGDTSRPISRIKTPHRTFGGNGRRSARRSPAGTSAARGP